MSVGVKEARDAVFEEAAKAQAAEAKAAAISMAFAG